MLKQGGLEYFSALGAVFDLFGVCVPHAGLLQAEIKHLLDEVPCLLLALEKIGCVSLILPAGLQKLPACAILQKNSHAPAFPVGHDVQGKWPLAFRWLIRTHKRFSGCVLSYAQWKARLNRLINQRQSFRTRLLMQQKGWPGFIVSIRITDAVG